MKKENKKIRAKVTLKRVITATVLAGGLLTPMPSDGKTADVKFESESIQSRVKRVRETLVRKITANENVADKLSYSEIELAQWGNWGNWNNWNNWRNWANWNNWNNWGNWRNY